MPPPNCSTGSSPGTASASDGRLLAARGQSPSLAFGHSKRCAFHGSCAPGTSSVRCSRLCGHSLLAARGQSPSLAFGHSKRCAFHGSCAPGTSSVRCSRLFGHSLLPFRPDGRPFRPDARAGRRGALPLLGKTAAGKFGQHRGSCQSAVEKRLPRGRYLHGTTLPIRATPSHAPTRHVVRRPPAPSWPRRLGGTAVWS
jgi:hypothetical protein